MADLVTLLRDLSEKAGKATEEDNFEGRLATIHLQTACRPALIQALVEVVMAAREYDADNCNVSAHMRTSEAVRRLEAMAQHLQS